MEVISQYVKLGSILQIGNLDPVKTQDIVQSLMENNLSGTTVVLATHNREVANLTIKRAQY